MEFSDYLYFGLRDGECRASGWKQTGKGADRYNARMVAEWIKKGLDVVTLHKDDPQARAHFDQMYEHAARRASAARAAESAT